MNVYITLITYVTMYYVLLISPTQVFRQTAGPWDIEMAKELRPGTIRSKYGTDKIRNAVHCTDLNTEGQMVRRIKKYIYLFYFNIHILYIYIHIYK